MSGRWQDDVTEQEWEQWSKFAEKLCNREIANNSLGFQDYAARSIEKLLKEKHRPDKIEAWLRRVIENEFRDRIRKINRRPRRVAYEDPEDPENSEYIVRQMLSRPNESMGSQFVSREIAQEVLSELSEKDRNIAFLNSRGWTSQEIADEMGYATSKVVANRIRIIRQNMVEKFGQDGKYLFKTPPKDM